MTRCRCRKGDDGWIVSSIDWALLHHNPYPVDIFAEGGRLAQHTPLLWDSAEVGDGGSRMILFADGQVEISVLALGGFAQGMPPNEPKEVINVITDEFRIADSLRRLLQSENDEAFVFIRGDSDRKIVQFIGSANEPPRARFSYHGASGE